MKYQDQILLDIQKITGIPNLTKQELYSIIINLIRTQKIYAPIPVKYIQKATYMALREFLLDGDSFVSGISVFQDLHKKYQDWLYKKSDAYKREQEKIQKELDNITDYNAEEDMDAMSKQLLRDDDVYYTNESYNLNTI